MQIKARKIQQRFKLIYEVETQINSSIEDVWTTLTNIDQYCQWNTTILEINGSLELGQKIQLKSILDPKRTFTLKVAELEAPHKMVWRSGAAPMFQGVRTYILKAEDGLVKFSMQEILSGIMLPLISKTLPDFRNTFEQFASDLKTQSEKPNLKAEIL